MGNVAERVFKVKPMKLRPVAADHRGVVDSDVVIDAIENNWDVV